MALRPRRPAWHFWVGSSCKAGCCLQLVCQERMLLLRGVCAVPPALTPSCAHRVMPGGWHRLNPS